MAITIQNPVIYADAPDMAVVRVDHIYYMISTSMHSFPGCPIMKSTDLANWELVSYVFDRLEETPGTNLADGKGIYGQGSWAVSFRYHEGVFYCAFSCNDRQKFYVYSTRDIENGTWERRDFEGLRHDPTMLFDEDGKTYVIYGNGDLMIEEWEKDMSAPKEGGLRQLLFSAPTENIMLRCEGGHAYKWNGMYYLSYIEWPHDGHQRRRQICYRSENLLGPYERKLILDDDAGYYNRGIAQGEIFDTPEGDWYAMLFQDHNAVGRIPYILPVTFVDGWPMVGTEGKAPISFEATSLSLKTPEQVECLSCSDGFEYEENRLDKRWQWNHHPDNALWSVTANPGKLRLTTGQLTNSIIYAPNTLTQRTYGPACTVQTQLDSGALKDGDYAGIVALQGSFGAWGIRKGATQDMLELSFQDGNNGEAVVAAIPVQATQIHLKIDFLFEKEDPQAGIPTGYVNVDQAYFSWSLDGENWQQAEPVLQMRFTLDHFMGCRAGLFAYASKEAGGFAEFSYFKFSK